MATETELRSVFEEIGLDGERLELAIKRIIGSPFVDMMDAARIADYFKTAKEQKPKGDGFLTIKWDDTALERMHYRVYKTGFPARVKPNPEASSEVLDLKTLEALEAYVTPEIEALALAHEKITDTMRELRKTRAPLKAIIDVEKWLNRSYARKTDTHIQDDLEARRANAVEDQVKFSELFDEGSIECYEAKCLEEEAQRWSDRFRAIKRIPAPDHAGQLTSEISERKNSLIEESGKEIRGLVMQMQAHFDEATKAARATGLGLPYDLKTLQEAAGVVDTEPGKDARDAQEAVVKGKNGFVRWLMKDQEAAHAYTDTGKIELKNISRVKAGLVVAAPLALALILSRGDEPQTREVN